MTTITEVHKSGKCAVEFMPAGPRSKWLVARPDGAIIEFNPGAAGKRAALLSALTHDAPALAAQVEMVMQRWPDARFADLHNRFLRGGFIARDNGVELLHRDHYRVQSQSNPETRYIVSWYDGWTNCNCDDHHNGKIVHIYNQPVKTTYAPLIPGFGVTCKHIAAAWLYQQITPMYTCPACNGNGVVLTPRLGPLSPRFAWIGAPAFKPFPVIATPCEVCQTRGVLFDPELADLQTGPNQPAPAETPMAYEDRPLSDAEYFDYDDLLRMDQR